jgi:hypothetical protein
MANPKLGYTAYQARTQWYMNHWGLPAFVREVLMEDGRTKLGIMAFPPERQRQRLVDLCDQRNVGTPNAMYREPARRP